MDQSKLPADILQAPQLFEDFRRTSKGKKRIKYPPALLACAIDLLSKHPPNLVQSALKVSDTSIVRWRKRNRKTSTKKTYRKKKEDFIELPMMPPMAGNPSIEIAMINGQVIRFPSSTPLNYVNALIVMLHGEKNA